MKNQDVNRFDEKAAQWDEKPQRLELAGAAAQAILRAIPLNRQMTALEFGCGTGLVTMQMAPHLRHIDAIDTSAGMLEVLNRKIQAQSAANITTRQIDLMADSLPGVSFDFIFSSMVLHHIEDTKDLLRRFFRLLKPGGFLALVDLEKEDGQFHTEEKVPHHGFDPEEVRRPLEQIGFRFRTSLRIHTIMRPDPDGIDKAYPVFLLAAQKV